MVKCWKCGAEQPDLKGEKMSFRAICDKCGEWQHCCVNCRYYKKGMPNDCLVPGTEFVRDRESNNFCDEFAIKDQVAAAKTDPGEASKKLFGEDPNEKKKKNEDPKDRFRSLFGE